MSHEHCKTAFQFSTRLEIKLKSSVKLHSSNANITWKMDNEDCFFLRIFQASMVIIAGISFNCRVQSRFGSIQALGSLRVFGLICLFPSWANWMRLHLHLHLKKEICLVGCQRKYTWIVRNCGWFHLDAQKSHVATKKNHVVLPQQNKYAPENWCRKSWKDAHFPMTQMMATFGRHSLNSFREGQGVTLAAKINKKNTKNPAWNLHSTWNLRWFIRRTAFPFFGFRPIFQEIIMSVLGREV